MKRLSPGKILLMLALLAMGGCKTEKEGFFDKLFPPLSDNQLDRLPPETQSGQRTFGCLLNGQAWTQVGNPFGGPILVAEWYKDRLSISCIRAFDNANGSANTKQSIAFVIDPIAGPGNYQLNDSNLNLLLFSDYRTNCQYSTGGGQVATVQITRWDPVARIVSGRFAFTLETPGCGKVVVTDGRFDCRF